MTCFICKTSGERICEGSCGQCSNCPGAIITMDYQCTRCDFKTARQVIGEMPFSTPRCCGHPMEVTHASMGARR
jgi:hypothetical protein